MTMLSSRFNQRHMLAAVVALLLISSLLPASAAAKVSYVPRSVLAVALNPFLQPMHRVSARFRGPAALPREAVAIQTLQENHDALVRENAALREHLIEAARRLAEYEMMDENAIRLQLNLEGLRRIAASVTRSYDHRLVLNRGRTHGMREEMIVVTGPHLVGQVIETSALSSTVRLITSPDNVSHRLAVRILGSPHDSARAHLDTPMMLQLREGGAFVGQCRVNDPIAVGDIAVMADRRWRGEAMGFFVGRVMAVEPDPNDRLSYRIITVQPMVSLNHLNHVVALIPALQ